MTLTTYYITYNSTMSLEEPTAELAAAAATTPPSLAAVSIKLPPFWPTDPTVWFLQVEAQFNTRGISSQKTQFDYVVASLPPEIAFEIRDLLIRPPTDTPYDTLKAELIKRTAASEQRKLQQLISGEISLVCNYTFGCNSLFAVCTAFSAIPFDCGY